MPSKLPGTSSPKRISPFAIAFLQARHLDRLEVAASIMRRANAMGSGLSMLRTGMPCGASLEIGWIPVRRTVDRDEDVEASDHVEIHVRLLPILEEKAQDAILEDELEKRGWTKEADGAMTKVFGDVVARLPAGGRTVRI